MKGAYYNEWDPKAAAWIRELIKRGLVAPGDVDERSIVDVRPDDLKGYTQCHFFSGIAVWSYALRRAGWADGRPCWTGSPPCQPFSAAGQQKGVDDERHLAPAWLELIKACRPEIVFGEQVASSLVIGSANKKGNSRGKQIIRTDNAEDEAAVGQTWIDSLQSELEDARYIFGAIVTNSCSFGAPHIRKRLRFIAKRLDHAASARHVGPLRDAERPARDEARLRLFGSGSEDSGLAVAEHTFWRSLSVDGQDGRDGADSRREKAHGVAGARGEVLGLADTERLERERGRTGGTGTQPGEIERIERLRNAGGLEHGTSDGRLERGPEPSGRRATGGCGAEWLADNQSEHRERESSVERSGPDAGSERVSAGGRLHTGRLDDDNDEGLEGQRSRHSAEGGRVAAAGPVAETGEPCRLADANGDGRGEGQRYDQGARHGHPVAATNVAGELDDGGRPGPTNGFWSSADWLFCRDSKWRPVKSGYVEMADGPSLGVVSGGDSGGGNLFSPLAHKAPARVMRLRGYGNCVDAEATRIFIEAAVEALDDLGAEGLSRLPS